MVYESLNVPFLILFSMREYKIKRGHNPDIGQLVKQYYGVSGDIVEGIEFSAEGVGSVTMKQDKKRLIVDIVPPKTVSNDYSVIKKWNDFLLDATGKNAKERRKDMSKMK